jgi:hypothetical protein
LVGREKVKDLDVIQDILWKASRRLQRIVEVKVSGHTGDPLHSEADIEAGAAAEDDLAEAVFDAKLACVPRMGFGDEHRHQSLWPSNGTEQRRSEHGTCQQSSLTL